MEAKAKTAMVYLSEGKTLTIQLKQMKLFATFSAAIAAGTLVLTATPASAQFYNVTPSYGYGGSYGGTTIRNNSTGQSTTFTPSYGGGGTYYNNNGGGGIVLPQGNGYSIHSY